MWGPQCIGWLPVPPSPSIRASNHERFTCRCRQGGDDGIGQPRGAVTPPLPESPRRSAIGKPTGPAATPPSYDCPGFPALLLRVGVSITMYISKREPTIAELLADPVMLTML